MRIETAIDSIIVSKSNGNKEESFYFVDGHLCVWDLKVKCKVTNVVKLRPKINIGSFHPNGFIPHPTA